MKKNYVCFFFFCLFVLLFSFGKGYADAPLNGKVIVIDVGHGGVDPGTVSGDVYEKDINLSISLALKKELTSLGAKVLMTRSGDYDLGTPKATYRKKSDFDHRILFINQSHADYFVSIHLNYLEDSAYHGAQVFYSKKLEQNKEIASKIQEYVNSSLGMDREIKPISNSIYMYSKLDVPGVLVECGFLSNPKEKENLLNSEYIQKFSRVLAEAFLKI